MKNDLCNVTWLKTKTKNEKIMNFERELNIVDLFCGCGGLSLGVIETCLLNNIKPQIKFAIDSKEVALNIYKKNFTDYLSDVKCDFIENYIDGTDDNEISEKEQNLIDNLGNIDILLAGPPCQGHSRLNNYTRSDDPRNKLYLNAIRAVKILKPKVAIIENVKNIIYDKNNLLNSSDNILKSSGYFVQNLVINAFKFGIAQKRTRHIQIATQKDINLDLSEYERKLVISDVIDDLVDEYQKSEYQNKKILFYTSSKTKDKERIDYLFDNDLYDLPDELRPDCHKNKNHTYHTSYGRLKWDQASTTITRGFGTMGQGRFIHPLRRRTLTPHEAARIQGFPDFFDFSVVKKRSDLHLMIANAVPPKISAMIIDKLIFMKEI